MEKKELISTCCHCKKVKINDQWTQNDDILNKFAHSLSHGVCPACLIIYYPSVSERVLERHAAKK